MVQTEVFRYLLSARLNHPRGFSCLASNRSNVSLQQNYFRKKIKKEKTESLTDSGGALPHCPDGIG